MTKLEYTIGKVLIREKHLDPGAIVPVSGKPNGATGEIEGKRIVIEDDTTAVIQQGFFHKNPQVGDDILTTEILHGHQIDRVVPTPIPGVNARLVFEEVQRPPHTLSEPNLPQK